MKQVEMETTDNVVLVYIGTNTTDQSKISCFVFGVKRKLGSQNADTWNEQTEEV